MTPDRTPKLIDAGTVERQLNASFDGFDHRGNPVRLFARFKVALPWMEEIDLPVVARVRDVPRMLEGAEAEYLGFDGHAYFPARHVADRSVVRFGLGCQVDEIERYAGILPEETMLQLPAEHRLDGRRLTRHSHTVRREGGDGLRKQNILHSEKLIDECGDLLDLATVYPALDVLRSLASRTFLVAGRQGLHVRTPLPVWKFPIHDDAVSPKLAIPNIDDLLGMVTAFAHHRADAARAYSELPSVRGRRQLGPFVGMVEVEQGWSPTDDLSWVARVVGRHWITNLDPVLTLLSPSGVRAWHLGVNADALVGMEGRSGAEAVLSALMHLRGEVRDTPALARYGFFVNKTRELADRLVHIEGMTVAPGLHLGHQPR